MAIFILNNFGEKIHSNQTSRSQGDLSCNFIAAFITWSMIIVLTIFANFISFSFSSHSNQEFNSRFSQFLISLFTQAKSNCYFILSLRAQQTFIVFVRSSFVLISFNSFHFVSMSCGKFVCLIIAATAVSIYNLFVDVWGVRWALSSGNDKQQQPTAPEARVLYSDLNDDVDGADGDRNEQAIGMPALTHVLLYWHDYQLFYFSLYQLRLCPQRSPSHAHSSALQISHTHAHTHLPPLSVSLPRSHFKLKFSSLEVSN